VRIRVVGRQRSIGGDAQASGQVSFAFRLASCSADAVALLTSAPRRDASAGHVHGEAIDFVVRALTASIAAGGRGLSRGGR